MGETMKLSLELRARLAGRSEPLCALDLLGGAGWDEPCPSLGLPVPGLPSPHAHKRR